MAEKEKLLKITCQGIETRQAKELAININSTDIQVQIQAQQKIK